MKNRNHITAAILIALIGSGTTLPASAFSWAEHIQREKQKFAQCDPRNWETCEYVLDRELNQFIYVPWEREEGVPEPEKGVPGQFLVAPKVVHIIDDNRLMTKPLNNSASTQLEDNFNNIQIAIGNEAVIEHFVTGVHNPVAHRKNDNRGSFLNVYDIRGVISGTKRSGFIGLTDEPIDYIYAIHYDPGGYGFPVVRTDKASNATSADIERRIVTGEEVGRALVYQKNNHAYDFSLHLETNYEHEIVMKGSPSIESLHYRNRGIVDKAIPTRHTYYNNNYLSYGYWNYERKHGDRARIMGAFVDGGAYKFQAADSLTGTARYEGGAIGLIDDRKIHGKVELFAEFDEGLINGTINGMEGGEETPVLVMLKNAAIENNGSFSGTMRASATLDDLVVIDGVWGGQFYGKHNPSHAAGTLGGSNGDHSLVMVYGADIQEATDE